MTMRTEGTDTTHAGMAQQAENAPDPASEKEETRQKRQRRRFLDWLNNEFDYTRPRRNEVREGTILDIGDNDVVVDIGAKRDAIVPRKDLDRLDDEVREGLSVGDNVPVVVLRTWGPRDRLTVSINRGLQQQDWLRAQELLESGDVVEAKVTGVNRGGVIAAFGRVRGFVPNSHLSSVPRGLRGERLKEAKTALVGKTLPLVVIEVNQRRRRLVLSERKADHIRRAKILAELTEGDVRVGIVSSIVDFGAFVNLGGVDGLVHISELDWGHVDHPGDVLSVGEKVEVYVLSVDRERERISLSRKRLLPDPWYTVTDNLQVGQTIDGTVTNVRDFGAFVDVGQGIEGLVHVSEMPLGRATLTELDAGASIQVRVLEIDHVRRRIALSLRGIAQTVLFPEDVNVEDRAGAPEESASEVEGDADSTLSRSVLE